MTPSELLRELHESNKRLQARLDHLERKRLEGLLMTAEELAKFRWLEKDYEDDGGNCSRDWTK